MDGYLRAEISLSAIQHNIHLLRSCAPGVRLCPVVKANAYGHGIRQILGVVGQSADMLGVAICSEAVALREFGWQRPVVMFATAGTSEVDSLGVLIVHDVTLTLTALQELPLLRDASAKAHRAAQVHIKIDSGMSRSGVLPEKAVELFQAARECDLIRVVGCYTHFACAEEPDKSVTLEQLRRFLAPIESIGGQHSMILHAANSAATIDIPQTHLDMIRPGMAVYGYQPGDEMQHKLPLRPCLRLVAPVMQLKDIQAGAAAGYGLTYRFEKDAKVALVPIGYADGYFRALSNKASMRVRGMDCPIRGRISMDQTIIEVTAVPDVKVGDQVEIISSDPAAPHSVDNLSRLAGTIPYEIVPRLGDRVRRVVVP